MRDAGTDFQEPLSGKTDGMCNTQIECLAPSYKKLFSLGYTVNNHLS